MGAVLGMTSLFEASAAVIAGMLVVRSVLDRVLNAVLFGLTTWLEQRLDGKERSVTSLE